MTTFLLRISYKLCRQRMKSCLSTIVLFVLYGNITFIQGVPWELSKTEILLLHTKSILLS